MCANARRRAHNGRPMNDAPIPLRIEAGIRCLGLVETGRWTRLPQRALSGCVFFVPAGCRELALHVVEAHLHVVDPVLNPR